MLIVTGLLGFVLIALLAYISRSQRHDPREPEMAASRIPFLGHMIGFFTHGLEYFAKISSESGHPILTLDMLLTKVYVTTSPQLVSAIRQSHRSMSFEPLFVRVAKCLSGIKGPGLDLLRGDGHGGPGLSHYTAHAMRPGLLGDGLDQINASMIGFLTSSVDDLASQDAVAFDLFEWCRDTMTIATTAAVYGEQNPYQSSSFREAFWNLESNVIALMVDIAPSILGRKAWKAREYMAQAFVKYYKEGGHLNSSMLTYDRWKTQADAGASLEDIAGHEIPTGLAINSNTVPTCFWTVFDIYSRPDILDEIRDELLQNVVKASPDGARITLDLADIRNKCPLLLSSYQETLRVRSNSAQLRVLYKDTMLDGRYLLKAGSILLIPSAAVNRSKSVWGGDADEVDPRRFVASEQDIKQKASGFLSFGLAPHVCTGRHFATGEILGVTALLLLRFDLGPVLGSWIEPRTNKGAVGVSTGLPAEAFNVYLKERKEFAGVEWDFQVTPGQAKGGLVIG